MTGFTPNLERLAGAYRATCSVFPSRVWRG